MRIVAIVLTLYIAFVFIQSLFFKFIDAPETIVIFTTIDNWAYETFGVEGWFLPGGIFSAFVIGSAELVASLLLLAGLFTQVKWPSLLGALMAFGIISGAIFFHLMTPLGIVVGDEEIALENGVVPDGGLLFYMACGVLVASLILIIVRARTVFGRG